MRSRRRSDGGRTLADDALGLLVRLELAVGDTLLLVRRERSIEDDQEMRSCTVFALRSLFCAALAPLPDGIARGGEGHASLERLVECAVE